MKPQDVKRSILDEFLKAYRGSLVNAHMLVRFAAMKTVHFNVNLAQRYLRKSCARHSPGVYIVGLKPVSRAAQLQLF